jgi:hypothetical protein
MNQFQYEQILQTKTKSGIFATTKNKKVFLQGLKAKNGIFVGTKSIIKPCTKNKSIIKPISFTFDNI